MSFNAGTSTSYEDMLNQFVQVITSSHVDSIAIIAGGTGYVVGEILDLDGSGTKTHDAQIEVLTVSGGIITVARVYRGGAYTVNPDLTANVTVSTGSGINATFDLTMGKVGWEQITRRVGAASAIPVDAGSGYSVNDLRTLLGGVLVTGGAASVFKVLTIDSDGGVLTGTFTVVGDYEVFPDNNVLVDDSGGGGSLLTLQVATINITGDTTLVLQGNAGTATDPLVGIKSYSDIQDESSTENVANWALFGMTTWDKTKALHNQANISPGFDTGAGDGTLTTLSGTGSYVPLVPLAESILIKWTIRAQARSVVADMEVDSASTSPYEATLAFGHLNQLGIESERPFPMFIAGSSDRKKVWYKDTLSIWGGITEPITLTDGPVYAYTTDDGWVACRVAKITSVTDTTPDYGVDFTNPRGFVWPLGTGTTLSAVAADIIVDEAPALGFDNDDLTLATPTGIFRTPQTSGDVPPFFPVTLMQINAVSAKYRVFGEIDGVHWFHKADSAVTVFDRFVDGTIRRTVFRNGTRSDLWSYFAVQEN